MPKTKIKELLKDVKEMALHKLPTGEDALLFEDAINRIEKHIKSLRKENKRVKKQLIDVNDSLAAAVDLLTTTDLPVAEFKCAKTNKPERIGSYLCIVMGNKPYFSSATWDGDKWLLYSGSHVIAFTDTDPAQIVYALNKEK